MHERDDHGLDDLNYFDGLVRTTPTPVLLIVSGWMVIVTVVVVVLVARVFCGW